MNDSQLLIGLRPLNLHNAGIERKAFEERVASLVKSGELPGVAWSIERRLLFLSYTKQQAEMILQYNLYFDRPKELRL